MRRFLLFGGPVVKHSDSRWNFLGSFDSISEADELIDACEHWSIYDSQQRREVAKA